MDNIYYTAKHDDYQNAFENRIREQRNALDIRYYVGIMLRRRWFIIIILCATMIASLYLAVSLRRMYQAETLIFIEPQLEFFIDMTLLLPLG